MEKGFHSFARTARSRHTVSSTCSRLIFKAWTISVVMLMASPAMANNPAAHQGLNGWLVLGVITTVLASGLFLQSTTRRIR
ncbi:hypothetical protein F3N42_12490 [Marinihelvus fidelis]|uniref:Uncharacterized protein n=1 Tax=Marinihelvus fidelis TaxID=2613842 RepID=A0A5N0T7M6_9GAMM|nr:hypothetical protein [Marinihelvus fidelis]KAA9130504.1 hypothetical protein F3N42_12490 [Marinihelvus fidelis]